MLSALLLGAWLGGCVPLPDETGDTASGLAAAGGTYTFTRAGSGKCLDLASNGTADGTRVQQWACNGTQAQTFRLDDAGAGQVRVVGPYSGKCLDVTAAGTADATAVQLYTCNGTAAQSWVLEDVGSGYARVRNPHSGKCLDVAAASADDGAQVQIYGCNGTSAQSWLLASAGGTPPPPSSPPTGACTPSWTVTASCGGLSSGQAPNLGSNVIVFDPSMSAQSIQSRIDSIYALQDAAQFGSGRYALLFKPGTYNLDVKIGFYTEVLGLGWSPDAVWVNGAVRVKADWLGNNNATCNFWRGAENLAVQPSGNLDGGTDVFAVSQGTELRRFHVNGNLALSDNGWSSGGFIADSLVDGTIYSGTQQQFLTRNDDQRWNGQSWNMVFVGDSNPPSGNWPNPAYTVIARTPVIREKPFLYIDPNGHWAVMVPALKTQSLGRSWAQGAAPGLPVSLDRFYVAHPGDSAATLNAQLAAGKHLLFTPGLYPLDASLNVTQPNTLVLGLGLATLTATRGTPLVTVADVDGVTVGGLLLEAGATSSPTLLQLGPPGASRDHAANPSALFDLRCRVGGAQAGAASSCVTVNSDHALLDNLWLWRADHGTGAGWYSNPSPNGLIVNGTNVTAYGLFVEHFQQYQTLWNGNGGAVYFYQSELPYDPPNQNAWNAPGGLGWPSYKVADQVTSHQGRGIGIYGVFTNYITLGNAAESPNQPGVALQHLVSVSLASGQILHLVNGLGGAVGNGTQTAFSSF